MELLSDGRYDAMFERAAEYPRMNALFAPARGA
jgi:hypothetical protein